MSNFLVKEKNNIHGFGIFTKRKIFQGEKFYTIPINKLKNRDSKRYAHIGNNQWANDSEVLNWVNHSCQPNTRLDISVSQPVLIALTDIKPDEEITCDYNQTEPEPIKFECNCGNHKKIKKWGEKNR